MTDERPSEHRAESEQRKTYQGAASLRQEWEAEAAHFIEWARTPGLDYYYWEFNLPNLLELLPSPRNRTLDLGCGEGRLAREMCARGHRVVGVDGSPTLIAAAAAAAGGPVYVVADSADLPLNDRSCDLVVACMSLQDVDDLAGTMRAIARVLTPDGTLCAVIPHPMNSAGRLRDEVLVIDRSYFEIRRWADRIERDGW